MFTPGRLAGLMIATRPVPPEGPYGASPGRSSPLLVRRARTRPHPFGV